MSWSQPAFEAVAGLVGQRTGLSFANRQDSAELGIRRAMSRTKVTAPAQYLDLIAGDEGALDDLVCELTVGETYFFREPGQFEFIRRQILPDIRRRRGTGHVIRAWSTACASGEEAYSLAIVFEEEGLGTRSHILATDISHKALAKARQALYAEWSLRGENGKAALRYLLPTKKGYRLDEKVQRRVTFEPLNLALDAYPSFATGTWGMDLILCRNVLIYFDRKTVRSVARRLCQALAEGGWLITASADPPLWEDAPFEVVTTEEGVFYRRPASAPLLSPEAASFVVLPAESEPEAAGIEIGEETGGKEDSSVAPGGDTESQFQSRDREGAAPRPLPYGRGSEKTKVRSNGNAPAAGDLLAEARQAFAQGDYALVVQLTHDGGNDDAATALRVRALANLDLGQAERVCASAAARRPLSPELSYLHAVLLLNLGRLEEAVRAMRRVVYLDRSLAVAHFTLGSMLRRQGDLAGARRAYRNARNLCVARPADEILPLADGEPAGRLAEVAGAELALLEPCQGEP